jgi:uncharacterized protein (TIGR02246 family)
MAHRHLKRDAVVAIFAGQKQSYGATMKHTVAVLAALLLPMTAAAAQTQTKSCPAVTTAQVESQFDRFNAAWATKNPDTVSALFTKDATLLATVSNEERDTPEEIRDYFVTFLKSSPVGTINSSTTVIDCNTAKRSGEWTVKLTGADGKSSDVLARYSFLYAYDGKDWKIAHLHSSARPPKN